MMNELVSCLCISEGRVPMLRRAVALFEQQIYPNRELLIVYRSSDEATKDYVRALGNPSIRGIEAPAGPQLQLGGLRNLSVAASRGSYIATWDDDDWHAPERLQAQMDVIREHARPACVLRRCQVYDVATQRAFISQPYTWELSLLCEKAALPEYPNITRGEDRHVVNQLLHAHKLIELERPDLYIYVYHGGNTCGRTHFKRNVFANAEPLGREAIAAIRSRLEMSH
jgi:glycosyltransferase involved in cell wall biosynthesis